MTGPTLTLTPEQERELRRYSDGEPRKPAQRPNRNLIRRNMLTSALTTRGPGFYRITEFGRLALRVAAPETTVELRLRVRGTLSERDANKLVDGLIRQEDDRLVEYEVTAVGT